MEIYRRLAHAREAAAITELHEELRDRFGRLPVEAENLIYLSKIRLLGRLAGFAKITLTDRLVVGYFTEKLYNRDNAQIQNWLAPLVTRTSFPIEFVQKKSLAVKIHFPNPETLLQDLMTLLEEWLKAEEPVLQNE